MSARRRRRLDGGWRRRGAVRVTGWLVAFLVVLSLVTWRQTRGVEMERVLRGLESERAIAEAEKAAEIRRTEELHSRARIVGVARGRLGMHLPGDDEIVFLPVAGAAGSGASDGQHR